MQRPFYCAPYIPCIYSYSSPPYFKNIKTSSLILSTRSIFFLACVVGGCAWQFGGLSCEFDILFPSDNHFSQGMEREDLYFYGQSDEYGDNFLSSLLDNPPPPQQ
jgi:hypothetical protein